MKDPTRLLDSSQLPPQLALALRSAPAPTPAELQALGGQLGLGQALQPNAPLRVVDGAAQGGSAGAQGASAATGASTIWTSMPGMVIGACVIGGAVLGAGVSALGTSGIERADTPAPRASATLAAPPGPAVDPAVAAPIAVSQAAPATAVDSPPSRRARSAAPSVVAAPVDGMPADEPELSLLNRARGLLSANPEGALALCAEHQRRFPRAVLGQEREVIAIDAQLRLGHAGAARARAERFAAAYPGSAHLRRINTLLDTSALPR